ncbi:MAG: translocation/assembly module TamB domain-containing protein, partial [Acidobacteriota bacterium]
MTLLLFSLAGLSTILYLRSDRFNRTAVGYIESKLREYGLRVEVGTLAFSLKPRTARLENLRIINDSTGRLIATVKRLDIAVELRDPLGLRQNREVRVETVRLNGLDLHLSFDKQGVSNLEGLKRPVTGQKAVEIDYSDLQVGLTGSRLHFDDERINFGIDLEGVEAQARARGDQSLAIELMAGQGLFGFEGRQAPITRVELRGEAAQQALRVERLRLESAIGQIEAQGRLGSWSPFSYEFDFGATGRLEEISRLFAPGADLRGTASCQCRITGETANFLISGDPGSTMLGIGTGRLEMVRLTGASLRREGDLLELAAREVKAARVLIGSVSLEEARIAQTRGVIAAGRIRLDSSLGTVAGISWPGSRLEGLRLTPLQTSFIDRRYQVRAAATLEDGVIEGVPIHDARAQADFNPQALSLESLEAGIDEGRASATITIPLDEATPFRIDGQFSNLPTRRLFSIFNVGRIPLAGSFTGEANLEWRGGAADSLAGMITADFSGGAPGPTRDIPVSGSLRTTVQGGVFSLAQCELRTIGSTVRAGGTLAVDGHSELRLKIESGRATELVEIVRAIDGLGPLIDQYQPHLPQQFRFDGQMNGDLAEPVLSGTIVADPIGLRKIDLGRLAGRLYLSAREVRLQEAVLTDREGGAGRLELSLPFNSQADAGTLQASLDRMQLKGWLAALDLHEPVELADLLSGRLDGEAQLTGLPGRLNGAIRLQLREATVVRQPVESATATISFVDHHARLDSFNLRLPQTTVQAQGAWNLRDDSFSLDGQTSNISLALLAEALEFKQLAVDGSAEISFKAICGPRLAGQVDEALDWQRLSFNLLATTTGLQINQRPAGDFRIYAGTSSTGRLRAVLNSRGSTEREIVFATVELKERELPLTINGNLENVDLAPFIAILAPEQSGRLSGTVSGGVSVSGPLRNGSTEPSIDALRGDLTIRQLDLNVAGNQLRLAAPLAIELAQSTVTLPPARLVGSGVEISAEGRVGLADTKPLTIGMRANFDLSRLSGIDPSLTAFGTVSIEAQADGTVDRPNLSGAVDVRNLGVSSRELPFFLNNGNGVITLAGEQLQINSFRATANDGRFEARGSVRLDGLEPSEWRIELKAEQAELYYRELGASLSTALVVTGTPAGQTISGTVNATRLEYDSSLNLDNLIAGGGSVHLAFDPGSLSLFGSGEPETVGRKPAIPTRLDLRLEARDALEIRGEQLNAVGTALLSVSGPSHDPNITGRLEGESGFVRFRGQRYEITRATLDLLPGNGGVILNLSAESDFRGYRVSLGLAGQIDAIETTLRSEPALSRDEIISLITTGRTESGALTSQDPLRRGFGAAASLLTTGLISRPTEQLLGLSRFQIDPIIRPNANPAARLTVGQQLSRNLYVSYSTNLATEQDQTALTEYTFTNRFSALATYTQGGSSTRQGLDENVVTLELRGRQRFSLGFLPGPAPTPEYN